MGTDAAREAMLAGLTLTASTRTVSGLATSILETGHGPPLVLLHGGIECGGVMWAPVLAQLAERHRVIVPDLPGLGQSAPAPRLNADTFSGWFGALLDEVGVERPPVVAHSLVGSLAARFAVDHGDRLSRLVVYAAPAVGPYKMPGRLRYVAIRFAIRPTERNAERFDRFALLDIDATRRRDPAWFTAFQSYSRERAGERHVKRTMNQLVSTQTKPISEADLDRIGIPIALLWGRHDRMVPLEVGKVAAGRHGWPLYVVEHAAHAPHVEQPEDFVRVLALTGATDGG